jgi:multifunctional methyltransferase subunit TRM112
MFPEALTDDLKQSDDFLRRLHRLLFEFEVIEGKLTCPQCTRVYPITNGIVNIKMFDQEV